MTDLDDAEEPAPILNDEIVWIAEAFCTIADDRHQVGTLGPMIPRRLTEAEMSAWYFSRGYPSGDLYEYFARLLRVADAEFMKIQMRRLREAAERDKFRQRASNAPDDD